MDKALAKVTGTEARRAGTARGLTHQEVADKLGCSLEFYGRIERGGTIPSVPTLQKLRSVLGTSADALLGDRVLPVAHEPVSASPATPVDRRERMLRRVVRRLNDSDLPTLRVVNNLLLGVSHLHAAWMRLRAAGSRTSR